MGIRNTRLLELRHTGVFVLKGVLRDRRLAKLIGADVKLLSSSYRLTGCLSPDAPSLPVAGRRRALARAGELLWRGVRMGGAHASGEF